MYFEDGTAHQLIDFIHASNLEDTVHFMLVSSEHRPDQLEQFKQAGIVAILPKPFSSQQLQRAIRATVDLIEPESVELNLFDVEDLRVLFVDDSMTLHALRRVFENMGVVESNNGVTAIEILNQQSFDLIVTDFNMPEMSGSEFAQHVRQDPFMHTPILMVTAQANELQVTNIKQSGVDALTDKPFEPATLKKLLINLLGSIKKPLRKWLFISNNIQGLFSRAGFC